MSSSPLKLLSLSTVCFAFCLPYVQASDSESDEGTPQPPQFHVAPTTTPTLGSSALSSGVTTPKIHSAPATPALGASESSSGASTPLLHIHGDLDLGGLAIHPTAAPLSAAFGSASDGEQDSSSHFAPASAATGPVPKQNPIPHMRFAKPAWLKTNAQQQEEDSKFFRTLPQLQIGSYRIFSPHPKGYVCFELTTPPNYFIDFVQQGTGINTNPLHMLDAVPEEEPKVSVEPFALDNHMDIESIRLEILSRYRAYAARLQTSHDFLMEAVVKDGGQVEVKGRSLASFNLPFHPNKGDLTLMVALGVADGSVINPSLETSKVEAMISQIRFIDRGGKSGCFATVIRYR